MIDANGLVATNQRVIGTATSVEVQLTPSVKVAASVLAADPARDVAVLWIDPKVAASVRPVPLGCASAGEAAGRGRAGDLHDRRAAPRAEGHGVRHREPRGAARASCPTSSCRPAARAARSSPPAAAWSGSRRWTSEKDGQGAENSRVVRVDDVCDVVASAEKKMKDAVPPAARICPWSRRGGSPRSRSRRWRCGASGSLNPYQMSSPTSTSPSSRRCMLTGHPERAAACDAAIAARISATGPSTWRTVPPVLLVRVTPKMVESFWTTVARGAARRRAWRCRRSSTSRSGFSRMRAFCGDARSDADPPVQARTARLRDATRSTKVSTSFDPGALGPSCGSVKLVLYSEKEPEKGDTRVVDPKVLQQIWQDFAPFRPAEQK